MKSAKPPRLVDLSVQVGPNGQTAYTIGAAATATGMPAANLRYLARTGFLVPSVRQASGGGKGREALYGYSDLVAGRATAVAREAGVSLQALRKVVEKLQHRRDLERPLKLVKGARHSLAAARLFIDAGNGDVLLETGEDRLESLRRHPGQLVGRFVYIDLGAVIAEVDERVAELHRSAA